jgi:hypothetical protein
MSKRLTRSELLRRAALGGAVAATPSFLAGVAERALASAGQADKNKPPIKFGSHFSARVGKFPRTAYYRLGHPGEAAVVMVIDELLVGQAVQEKYGAILKKHGAYDTHGTVFAQLKPPPGGDVHIWRLRKAPDKSYRDIAAVITSVRKELPRKLRAQLAPQVAPNHVLIPAGNYHSCPFGPPEEPGPNQHGDFPAPTGPLLPSAVSVVVIDAGYYESPSAPRPSWLRPVEYGKWFKPKPTPSWFAEPAEVLYATPGYMGALVGHANFVAGVIAQACRDLVDKRVVDISVVNHNGAFVASDSSDTPIPTEASVARSIWEHQDAKVINVGFAFPTLPTPWDVLNKEKSGPPSWTFENVLNGIDRNRTLVVAPAGNQSSPVRQYPAAFHIGNPAYKVHAYPNVIGVGSISPGVPSCAGSTPKGQRSTFSNYGDVQNGFWVACCAEGEEVLSSFPSVQGQTEEAEPIGCPAPPAQKDFKRGLARWNGTSFAAPKVTAALATLMADGKLGLVAWNDLLLKYPGTGQGMGHVMSGLPPIV